MSFQFSVFSFPLSVYIIPPPPAGTPPVSGGESKRTLETRNLKPESTTNNNFVPLSQGDEREARRGYVKNYER